MKLNVGIDIGGTKINLGIVDEQGKITDSCRIPTNAKQEPELTVQEIVKTLKKMLKKNGLTLQDITFIGAGVPGTVNTSTGLVSYCPNLSWFDIPIGDLFERYMGRKVVVEQDSRNAALAEKLFGAGKGCDNILCVAVGTGIGGGIIIDGKIFHGGMNTAGEIGHTPIYKNGRKCVCGNSGCLEKYASGTGMLEIALERFPAKFQGKPEKCETLFKLAYEGDKEACALIDECVDDLAFGIANAVNLISPEMVIISGGLCEHEGLFVNPLQEKITNHGYYSWTRQNSLKVCRAILGSDAPMIGASALDKGI